MSKRVVIAKVSPPKGAFLTIKKDGSVGYKNKKTGRRVVLTKIKRRDGFIYFADGAGKVYEQVSTFGKKSASKKGAAKGSTKRRAKTSAKKTAKRATKKSPKRAAKKRAVKRSTKKRTCKRCSKRSR